MWAEGLKVYERAVKVTPQSAHRPRLQGGKKGWHNGSRQSLHQAYMRYSRCEKQPFPCHRVAWLLQQACSRVTRVTRATAQAATRETPNTKAPPFEPPARHGHSKLLSGADSLPVPRKHHDTPDIVTSGAM